MVISDLTQLLLNKAREKHDRLLEEVVMSANNDTRPMLEDDSLLDHRGSVTSHPEAPVAREVAQRAQFSKKKFIDKDRPNGDKYIRSADDIQTERRRT